MLLRPVLNLLHRVKTRMADFVAEVFCPSECVRLIQDQASMRNVDSRIHSLRFDCCVFLFYSFSAVTFATESAQRVVSLRFQCLDAIGVKADIARASRACRSEAIDPLADISRQITSCCFFSSELPANSSRPASLTRSKRTTSV